VKSLNLLSILLASSLLAGSSFGQSCGPGGCPPSYEWQSAPQQQAPPGYAKPAQPSPSDVRVYSDDDTDLGSRGQGSGTVFLNGALQSDPELKGSYVITNFHVVRSERDRCVAPYLSVQLPEGREYKAVHIGSDSGYDLAVVWIPVLVPAVEVAPAPSTDTTFRAVGYGGGSFKASVGRPSHNLNNENGEKVTLVLTAYAMPGMSGGAVYDTKGRLTGVVWGMEAANTGPCCLVRGMYVRRLLARIFGKRFEAPTPPQPEQKPMVPVDPTPAPVPEDQVHHPVPPVPPAEAPCPEPPVSSPEKSCGCDEKWAELEKKLDGINSIITKGGISITTIDKRLTAIEQQFSVFINAPPTAPVTPQEKIVHFVLVVDQNTEAYNRLRSELLKAQAAYHHIRVSGLPPFPIGEVPQLVTYVDGKPTGSYKGERNVMTALSTIARGQTPKP
jgi:hypothetical protein